MSGARGRAVIFDFDYTLADSSSGVIACANYALAAMGLPAAAMTPSAAQSACPCRAL